MSPFEKLTAFIAVVAILLVILTAYVVSAMGDNLIAPPSAANWLWENVFSKPWWPKP